MLEKLEKIVINAHAPYSKFHVAALLVMEDGTEIPGVNVENASYGATICAERNAILHAVALGYKKGDFKKIYVYVPQEKSSTPCFVCRQVITEFFEKEKEVICVNKSGEETIYKVSELCPHPFDESDLV